MKWPWVARERLDEAQARILTLEQERRDLTARLIARANFEGLAAQQDPDVVPFRQPVEIEKAPPVPTANPFDGIEDRMGRALREKKVPARFRARA